MKDYSNYFRRPSLKDARSRGHEETNILDDAFEIPAEMVNIGRGADLHYRNIRLSGQRT